MSDSADEYREVSEGVSFQIGESVVAYTYPLTEGLIVDRKVSEEGRVELTLLIAPRKKKGKSWSKAAISVRDAARLSKKPPAKFLFPIRGVEQLRMEAKRARADPNWIATARAELDKEFQQNELLSGDSESDQKEEEEETDQQVRWGRAHKVGGEEVTAEEKLKAMEKRIEEVMQLRGRKGEKKGRKGKKKKETEEEESDYETWKRWKRNREKRKSKRNRKRNRRSSFSESSSSASSSTSSSSSSNEDLAESEVGEKGSSGIFSCPFHKSDSRGFKDVRCQVQGQAVTRRHIRLALHNLYAEYHTLASFADKFVTKAYASPSKPFTMDVAWFQACAEQLDTMLLNSLEGPWALWNEPVVDQMMNGFLELMIRVSPQKDYPVCFDDAVRKWLKKKRVGTNAKFGPVSYAMQHAKFTEGGLVIQQPGLQRNRERIFNTGKQGNNYTVKNVAYPSSGGEKRAPPSSKRYSTIEGCCIYSMSSL